MCQVSILFDRGGFPGLLVALVGVDNSPHAPGYAVRNHLLYPAPCRCPRWYAGQLDAR
jgi:hypothetical protein